MAFMNERLKQFLAMENLSPARFAEVMGIQRSGISHLLAGRNKPSFEFLQKMMTAYPDINYEWLILGKGRPYKSDRPMAEIDAKKDIFTDYPEETTPDDSVLDSDDQSVIDDFPAEQPAENRVFGDMPAPAQPKTGRKIARIIVFFNDGTYEEK
jgi:transcriptional regulator with XRE-family HTH domain